MINEKYTRLAQLAGSSSVFCSETVTIKDAIHLFSENSLNNSLTFVNSAKNADVVILATGIPHRLFGDAEGTDRKGLGLNNSQTRQILNLVDQNPNLIVILFGGGPVAMEPWINRIPAILHVWQPHQEAGNGIVNLLFGQVIHREN